MRLRRAERRSEFRSRGKSVSFAGHAAFRSRLARARCTVHRAQIRTTVKNTFARRYDRILPLVVYRSTSKSPFSHIGVGRDGDTGVKDAAWRFFRFRRNARRIGRHRCHYFEETRKRRRSSRRISVMNVLGILAKNEPAKRCSASKKMQVVAR